MPKRLNNLLALAPVIGGLVTYGVYRLFFIEARIDGIGDRFKEIPLERDTSDIVGGLDPTLALLAWGVTGTFFVLSFIGGVVILLHIFRGALLSSTDKTRLSGFAVVSVAVLAIAMLTLSGNPFAVDSINGVLIDSFKLHELDDAEIFLDLFTPMVLIITVLLMACSWATLMVTPSNESDRALVISDQLRSINRTLFVGAVVLVASVVHGDSIHRLPSVLMSEADAPIWNQLIGALSASTGAIWTLLLLGIYLPSIVVIRLRVRALVMEKVDNKTPENVDKWLSTHGLSVQFPQLLAQFGAMVSPFLIGGPGASLIELFGA